METQIIAFERALVALQEHTINENGSWHPEDPMRGSCFNILSTDYDLDSRLTAACVMAGFEPVPLLFPMKTVMWVMPGSVRVACGYGAMPVEMFTAVIHPRGHSHE